MSFAIIGKISYGETSKDFPNQKITIYLWLLFFGILQYKKGLDYLRGYFIFNIKCRTIL